MRVFYQKEPKISSEEAQELQVERTFIRIGATCVVNEDGFRGFSFCHPGGRQGGGLIAPDRFSKAEGRGIALERAERIQNVIIPGMITAFKNGREIAVGFNEEIKNSFQKADTFDQLPSAIQNWLVERAETSIYSQIMRERISDLFVNNGAFQRFISPVATI